MIKFKELWKLVIARVNAFIDKHSKSDFNMDEAIAAIVTLGIFWILILNAPWYVVGGAIAFFSVIIGLIDGDDNDDDT